MQTAFVIVLSALLFVAVGTAAMTYSAPAIEREVARETQLRLRDAGLPEDGVFVDGRDIWVESELSGNATYERVSRVLVNVPGLREVRRRGGGPDEQPGAAAFVDIEWTDSTFTLRGLVGTERDLETVRGGLDEHLPGVKVLDSLGVDPALESVFWEQRIPAAVALMQESVLEGGISVRGRALVARGVVPNENVRTEVGEQLASALGGIRIVNRIRLPDASREVAVALAQIFDTASIEFEPQSETLTAASIVLLDRAASVLTAHPSVVARVEGYDDTGHPDQSRVLSLIKAGVVRDYLLGRGVRPSALEAEGMGAPAEAAGAETEEGDDWARVRIVVNQE